MTFILVHCHNCYIESLIDLTLSLCFIYKLNCQLYMLEKTEYGPILAAVSNSHWESGNTGTGNIVP